MKPLQNNFTTPEQSRRLLAAGLPFDSADCCYNPTTCEAQRVELQKGTLDIAPQTEPQEFAQTLTVQCAAPSQDTLDWLRQQTPQEAIITAPIWADRRRVGRAVRRAKRLHPNTKIRVVRFR